MYAGPRSVSVSHSLSLSLAGQGSACLCVRAWPEPHVVVCALSLALCVGQEVNVRCLCVCVCVWQRQALTPEGHCALSLPLSVGVPDLKPLCSVSVAASACGRALLCSTCGPCVVCCVRCYRLSETTSARWWWVGPRRKRSRQPCMRSPALMMRTLQMMTGEGGAVGG